ncbi:MAG: metal-dependent transcriptional regulator [Ignavibacteria bacterium]|nr:metal-dependent transcriptional regulator [Bacteroidota bacterium]MBL7127402.1 metal-dependent transcriptional regulator [Ignavibacteria bacterium]
MINKSIEDYLKNIYTIKLSVGKVSTSLLAEKLGISAAAVSDMVSKLSRTGYIKNTPYKGFELTKKGQGIAINLIRKHRIWEVFLLKHLKYPWEQVHTEAENLEHASSDELILKLEDFLEFPKYDPHGDPIPDRNGKFIHDELKPLSNIDIGESVTIKRVPDENPEVLLHLTKMGLKLNDKVKVVEKINFDNSIQILAKKNKIFLSEKLANSIFVDYK